MVRISDFFMVLGRPNVRFSIREQNDVVYVNWFSMVLSGLKGLQSYNADTTKWTQAHSQARYVILRVLLETAPELVNIQQISNAKDNNPDLLVTLNR